MNITPLVSGAAWPVQNIGDYSTVISVADRMKASLPPSQGVEGRGLWPVEEQEDWQEQQLQCEVGGRKDAYQDMLIQPFIEQLFYGEEEETGNVTLSTML